LPPKLEQCVSNVFNGKYAKRKWPNDKMRRSKAYAICQTSMKSDDNFLFVAKLDETKLDGWVQLLPLGTFTHPVVGEVVIDEKRIDRMIKNFKDDVRGIQLDIDYAHKNDPTKGQKAAGWIKDLKASNGLWALPDFTTTALKEIKDGEWKYMSVEFAPEWCTNDAEKKCYEDVLMGAALTNRPFMKKMAPINLDEFADDTIDLGEIFDVPDAKFSQEDAHYRPAYDSTRRCLNCAFFRDGECLVVDGAIDEDYYSDYFVAVRNDLNSVMYDEEGKPKVEPESTDKTKSNKEEVNDLDKAKIAAILGFDESVADEKIESETTRLVEFAKAHGEDQKLRKFEEDYPDIYKQMVEDRRKFAVAEADAKIAKWNEAGMPPAVNDIAKALLVGDKTVKLSDEKGAEKIEEVSFAMLFDAVLEKGLVPKGNIGGKEPKTPENGGGDGFLAVVHKYQEEHKTDAGTAMRAVAAEQPDLARAYYSERPAFAGEAAEGGEE
jgi:hypothetical protein